MTNNTLIHNTIYARLYPDVEEGVKDGVEKEKQDFRDGKNGPTGIGWLDAIIGMLFQFLEAMGLDKAVAGIIGIHIPDAGDKRKMSEQITNSISDVFARKEAAQMSKAELLYAVENQITLDVQNNPDLKAIMTPAQIARASKEAVARLGESYDEIHSMLGTLHNTAPVAAKVTLSGSPEEQVSQTLTAIGKSIVDGLPEEKRAGASAVIPALATVGTELLMKDKTLADNTAEFTKRYIAALESNQQANNALAAAGFNLSDSSNKGLMTQILGNSLERNKSTLQQAAKGQATAIGPVKPVDLLEGKDPKHEIAQEISKAIVVQTAEKVLEKYNGGGATGWYVKNADVVAAAKTLNTFKTTPPANEAEANAMYAAQVTLYDRAVEMKEAPNNSQRAIISRLAAQDAMYVITRTAGDQLSAPAMADQLQKSINDTLDKSTPAIDAAGIATIAKINSPVLFWNDKGDVLKAIATGIADKVRDPKNTALMDKIRVIQTSMLSKKAERFAGGLDTTGLAKLNGTEAAAPVASNAPQAAAPHEQGARVGG